MAGLSGPSFAKKLTPVEPLGHWSTGHRYLFPRLKVELQLFLVLSEPETVVHQVAKLTM